MLAGKNVLLGVTGGIAAYKTTFLVRLLIQQGAHVKVIMTLASKEFVTPLTLSTLSKNPVYFDFVDEKDGELRWNNHVEHAKWADLMILAPLTSNTLAKMVSGACDNLLLATYMSSNCPVFVAPAMDLDMYAHQSTKQNLAALTKRGVHVIQAESGFLASGLEGEGRMAEPETIVNQVHSQLRAEAVLFGKKVLISAGPTREAFDPVRFLSNYSTGLMGYELALRAHELGAEVVLVSGPVEPIKLPQSVRRIAVESAEQMYVQVMNHFDEVDFFISSAAVADYTFSQVHPQKLKKEEDTLVLTLQRTRDILRELASRKKQQRVIGFALETDTDLSKPLAKLQSKSLDAIVYNTLSDEGAGFGTDTNKATVFFEDQSQIEIPLQSKRSMASALWTHFSDKWL